jgi:DNA-binding NtrC family response regulator
VAQEIAIKIISLSDSFRSLWSEMTEELGVRCIVIEPKHQPGMSQSDTAAVVIAAGGEEDRGLDVLLSFQGSDDPPVYLVGANTSHRFGVEAVRRGATDYFALPDDVDMLRRTLASRVESTRERRSGAHARPISVFSTMIGNSPTLRETLTKAERILAHSDVTVLIRGETGTGKELLARAIHDGGPRGGGPFVAVNCTAIPPNLLESELFGHEKGAFTDAHQAKAGLFEEAHSGTLFLDEIGHLPLELQGKLLRVLEEKRIRRVGATETRDVDVRILAATHVDLGEAAERGVFRQDLYYRLNVVSLNLPPLRDRGDDLELLATHFVRLLADRYGLPTPRLSPDVMAVIRSHIWPGNVRELRHSLERALLLSDPGTIDPDELIESRTPRRSATSEDMSFPATLKEITRAAANRAVSLSGGNKSQAARMLGISRSRLQRLLDDESEEDTND